MKTLIDNIANYSGPGALITLLIIWLYVVVKKQKISFIGYMIYFPSLLSDYRELTKKEDGRAGLLYYIFIVLIIITFIFVFSSAF